MRARHIRFTQGETYEELLNHIKEAVSLHFEKDELFDGRRSHALMICP